MASTLDNSIVSNGTVITLGNFDGVHRGHRHVIAIAKKLALSTALPLIAVTFEPHPRTFFRPLDPPFRLTDAILKERLLQSAGVDYVHAIKFDNKFSQQSADFFIAETILQQMQARAVITGHDFVFGHNRVGNATLLQNSLAKCGVEFIAAEQLIDEEGAVISSSRVRNYLRDGKPERAAALLGHVYTIRGRVQHGDKRGRELGFPTANIALGEFLSPRHGVYAITVRRHPDAQPLSGIANIGIRPTVVDKTRTRTLLECHIFSDIGDAYGEMWEVDINYFVRPERKFTSIDELRRQITQDCEYVINPHGMRGNKL